MTPSELIHMGVRADRAATYAPLLAMAMPEFGIDTLLRKKMFLPQVLHESMMLRCTTELWGSEPTAAQSTYERDFSQPWGPDLQRGDRNYKAFNLGNSQAGDGKRYRGHGLLQSTGRYNHAKARDRLRARLPNHNVPDFEQDPESLALPLWAVLSACDFWEAHNLNRWADAGDVDGVSDVINRGKKTEVKGDANGFKERLALFHVADEVLA